MKTSYIKRIAAISAILSLMLSPVSWGAVSEIHFLIPGGAGGGWDGTARGVGKVLVDTKIIKEASYENLSGGGGGVAIAKLIKTKDTARTKKTLMVNSTPLIQRSLSKVFPQSFRDLVPVAGVIADYGALIVSADSPYNDWQDVVAAFKKDPKKVKVAGGSTAGSLDHIVAALAFQKSGGNAKDVIYISYDAGGKAMAGLLSGETAILSTGLGEALEISRAGTIRIIAISAPDRIADAPDLKTLKEQGSDVVFANWRGFFAAPGTSTSTVRQYNKVLRKMYRTDAWEATRQRNGWVNNYIAGPKEFYKFLEEQEKDIGTVLTELGFLAKS
ncbi:MAG: tripartite tricarboxylate transporter substrate binding protein [Gammaproteobacteria bacterium]|nr:tripartite tricarboxylate transporter substrate binding protein [Gammaproteobacteria bacterium]